MTGCDIFSTAPKLISVSTITTHMHRPVDRIAEAVSYGQILSRIQKHVRFDPQWEAVPDYG